MVYYCHIDDSICHITTQRHFIASHRLPNPTSGAYTAKSEN